MHNNDIRLTAAGKGVKLWQIAEKMGCTDSTLSRKLRTELSLAEKEKILTIISNLAESEAS